MKRSLLILLTILSLPAAAANSRPVADADDVRLAQCDRLGRGQASPGAISLPADLLDAALFAAGTTDDAERQRLIRDYEQWLHGIDEEALPQDTKARAAAIFRRLHADVLTGRYLARCSDVAAALQRGDFNCVTATVLYLHAARKFGMQATALATDGHVLCRVRDGQNPFEIETTCPRWFELTRRQADAARAERRPSRGRATTASCRVRQLSDEQLIAKIYYNRGVACFRHKQYEQGLHWTRVSLQFDPHDEIARGNVLAGLNNWALALCEQQEFARAAKLLDELRSLDPEYPTLDENEAHVYRTWARQDLQRHGEG